MKYLVKNKVKKAKNVFWEQKCVRSDKCIGNNKSRKAWKMLHSMKSNAMQEWHLVDPIGIEKWQKFYENLLTKN